MIINKFTSGLNQSIDKSELPETYFTEGIGVRLITVAGQGFIITNQAGNEYAFSLSEGFIPHGYTEYNGITYIASLNPLSNECEFGSYPSVDPLNNTFTHLYRPLYNWTGAVQNGPRSIFRTNKFEWDIDHPLEIEARVDYDNTVNLYFCDGIRPLRSVNSGFNQEGQFNKTLYWDGSFPNLVDVNSESPYWTKVTGSVTSGGQNKCGMYFVFIRYKDYSFNKTSIVGYGGPYQVSIVDDSKGLLTAGGSGTDVSNCKINIGLSNLDQNYPYFEVIVVRYTSGTSEISVINKLYSINSSTENFSIFGTEDYATGDSTLEEIVNRKISFDIPWTITQLNNKLWMANLTKRNVHHPDMFALAQAIEAKADWKLKDYDTNWAEVNNNPNPSIYHKLHQETLNEVGYFNTEPYPFTVQFLLKNGRISKAYPVKGYDHLLGTWNLKGIVRFPAYGDPNGYFIKPQTNEVYVLGVKFQLPPGSAGLVTAWITDNVESFIFKRGERKPNVLHNGIMLQMYNNQNPSSIFRGKNALNDVITNVKYQTVDRYFPFWKYYTGIPSEDTSDPGSTAPGIYYVTEPAFPVKVRVNQTGEPNTEEYAAMNLGSTPHASKFGFYSHDFALNANLDNNQDYYLEVIALINFRMTTLGSGKVSVLTKVGFYNEFKYNYKDTHQWGGIVEPDDDFPANYCNGPGPNNTYAVKGFAIQRYVPQANNQFVSKMQESSADISPDPLSFAAVEGGGPFGAIAAAYWNLAFGTTNYIGINNVDANAFPAAYFYLGGIGTRHQRAPMAVLYKQNPLTIDPTLLFEPANTIYYAIGQAQPIGLLTAVKPMVYYNGDCFIQRNYIRQFFQNQEYDVSDTGFGIMHGYTSQNAFNHAMRGFNATEDYWPHKEYKNAAKWVIQDNNMESLEYNVGYQQILLALPDTGFDIQIPTNDERLLTRIAYSSEHKNESFVDGYKIFDDTSYKDFDYRNGAIMKITSRNGALVSVQERAINLHAIDERALMPSENDGNTPATFLLGKGDILSPRPTVVTDLIGSQHRDSVKKYGNIVFGTDINKRIIWKLSEGLDPISDTKGFQPLLYSLIESLTTHSDIMHTIGTNMVNPATSAIKTELDIKNKEVLFMFRIGNEGSRELETTTIRYKIDMDLCLGTSQNYSPYYITLNNDTFSFTKGTNAVEFWKEEESAPKSTFFGTIERTKLKFVVNGREFQQGELTKYFENIMLLCSEVQPESITFETEFQRRVHTPFIDPAKPHLLPVYKDNKWSMAVGRNELPGAIYDVLSDFRGNWMEITIIWNTDSQITLKSVHTQTIISYA